MKIQEACGCGHVTTALALAQGASGTFFFPGRWTERPSPGPVAPGPPADTAGLRSCWRTEKLDHACHDVDMQVVMGILYCAASLRLRHPGHLGCWAAYNRMVAQLAG